MFTNVKYRYDCDLFLQWFQYDDSECEWLPEHEVTAAHLLEAFWSHVGVPREEFNGEEFRSSDAFMSKHS
jgi:hypothetical protein